MRVRIYPADAGGCGSYRLIWPGQAALAAGYDINVVDTSSHEANLQTICRRNRDGVEELVDVIPPDADVVVLQRPMNRLLADAIPMLQKNGIAVVVEIDDDFHNIVPQNGAWVRSLPQHDADRNRNHLMRACNTADLVTVTTPTLAKRYGFDHFRIIPNYVPAWYLTVEKVFSGPVRVGWSGSVVTHPTDLQEMRGAIPTVIRRTGASFVVVGSGEGVKRRVGLPESYDLQPTGWVPIEDYPVEMSTIDVGVVPLENLEFNHAKSWLKGLEFAALGVPFVASPTQPYEELFVQYGIGRLVDKPKAWAAAIQDTIDRRKSLGESYRESVRVNGLIVEERTSEWVDAWKSALDNKTKNLTAEP